MNTSHKTYIISDLKIDETLNQLFSFCTIERIGNNVPYNYSIEEEKNE